MNSFQDIKAPWAVVLALVAGTVATYVAITYSGQPIVEWEAFRQTATALTAYWMIEEGWRLAYQTPMLGYPWSIPLEFPIYQSIVAVIAWLGNFQLETVGRLVSFAFLLACAWPAFGIARRLKLPQEVAWIFCALLWSSPQYLYWGRTFLIETAALFFTLAAIPFALDLREPFPSYRSALFFVLFASMAILQKSTTAAPVIFVIGLVLLFAAIKSRNSGWHRYVIIGATLAVPIIVGGLWTYYAANVRAENFFGRMTMTPMSYIGSFKLRTNLDAWKAVIWDRILQQNAAGWLGIAVVTCGLGLGNSRIRILILVMMSLLLLPTSVFLFSHWLLPYYQTATTVFFLGSLTLSIFVLQTKAYTLAPVITVIFVISNLMQFTMGYGRLLQKELHITETRALALGDIIRRYTPKDSKIVVFGLTTFEGPAWPVTSYSPEVIYYARRKGLTVQDGWEKKMSEDLASYLGGKEPGAIVVCSDDLQPYMRFIRKYDEHSHPNLFKILSCYIWLPNVRSIIMANGQPARPITGAF